MKKAPFQMWVTVSGTVSFANVPHTSSLRSQECAFHLDGISTTSNSSESTMSPRVVVAFLLEHMTWPVCVAIFESTFVTVIDSEKI